MFMKRHLDCQTHHIGCDLYQGKYRCWYMNMYFSCCMILSLYIYSYIYIYIWAKIHDGSRGRFMRLRLKFRSMDHIKFGWVVQWISPHGPFVYCIFSPIHEETDIPDHCPDWLDDCREHDHYLSLKFYHSPPSWMVGRSFAFGAAYFQGRLPLVSGSVSIFQWLFLVPLIGGR